MLRYPYNILDKHRNSGVLFDTNLLLLLAVGDYSSDRIATFKRTQKFTAQDYMLVTKLLHYFTKRVTTPNILTEVDNLARQLPEREHINVSSAIQNLVDNFCEVYVESAEIIRLDLYPKVGITDSATIIATSKLLVVTDDFSLSNRLTFLDQDVLNLNHIRKLF